MSNKHDAQKASLIAVRLFGLIFIAIQVLAGCGAVVNSTIGVANQIDQSVDRSRRNDLVSEYLDWVKNLKAKGDPMGDYLWTRANEMELVANPVKDPAVLKKMYADAAAKGSVDAQLVLGLKRFYEGASKRRNYGGTDEEWRANVPIWKDGLRRIEGATDKQCWHYTPYIFPPHNKRCLTPISIAVHVWPSFRDGFVYPKDAELLNYWKQKDEACKASPGYQEARRMCQPFGS